MAVDTDEVGASQRHIGRAGTGFVLKPNTSSPGEFYEIIDINEYQNLKEQINKALEDCLLQIKPSQLATT